MRAPGLPCLHISVRLSLIVVLLWGTAFSQTPLGSEILLLTDLGGGQSRALGIERNATGIPLICGESETPGTWWRAAVWTPNANTFLVTGLPVLSAGRPSRASDVTRASSGDPRAVGFAYDGLDRIKPMYWLKNGANPWMFQNLPTLAGDEGSALATVAINDTFTVCGWSIIPPVVREKVTAIAAAIADVKKAVVWRQTPGWTVQPLPDFGAGRYSMAYDIASSGYDGVIAGTAEDLTGTTMPQAWVTSTGGATWIRESLPLPVGAVAGQGMAAAIDRPGQVLVPAAPVVSDTHNVSIGGYAEWPGGERHGVLWTKTVPLAPWTAEVLVEPAGYVQSQVYGMRASSGQYTTVGDASDLVGMQAGAYWYDDGQASASGLIGDLAPVPPGRAIKTGTAINNMGWITGWGLMETAMGFASATQSIADSDTVAYVLRPPTVTAVKDPPPLARRARIVTGPNPFRANLRVTFSVPVGGRTEVWVYDVSGRVVARLFAGMVTANHEYTATWDGGSTGRDIASGTYFVRVSNARSVGTTKVTLVR